jgi:Protein of unknown function (DUF3300)
MSARPIRVMASVVAVAIVAFPAFPALPDPAPASAAEAPAPSGGASVPTPSAENQAPASVTESPAAEADTPARPPEAQTPSIFKAEQLDQMLAPIALYPDALLAQILMAATYPLEVVKADRWLQDPAHANLQGDQLAAAIEAEAWDPSVKSLVPFPRILRMMDGELDWTEQLGNAVTAQQADVMDAIQRLRHQSVAAGTLWSNAEQRVTTERQGIVIEPVNPEFIYPPVYSPAVYGPWPNPDYPPLEVSPDEYGIASPLPFGLGFGAGFTVVQPLWRWCAFDWAQRRIQLDIEKFNTLNRQRAGIGTDTWRHDLGRRPSALYNDPASRTRFRPTISAAAIPTANVPSGGAAAPAPVSRSTPQASAAAGPLSTTVLRWPPPGGLQAPIRGQPGLAGPRIVAPPMMPAGVPRAMSPKPSAHSTASAPGSRAPVEGVSRR